MDSAKWKRDLKQKKFKRQKNLIISFLGIFILLLIISLIFRLYFDFKKSKTFGWTRINTVVFSENVSIVSLVPAKEAFFFELNGEEKIQLVRGYGEYQLKTIYKLGELDKRGIDLLKESIQHFFSIPISGAIVFPKSNDLEKILFESFLGKTKTDFTLFDLMNLWVGFKRIPRANIQQLTLKNLETANIDKIMEKYLFDEKISKENISIGVFNSTNFSGLAADAARIISNLGGRVVCLENSQFHTPYTLLKTEKKFFKSHTLKILKRIFQANLEEKKDGNERADVEIFLGEDYWKKLNEKW